MVIQMILYFKKVARLAKAIQRRSFSYIIFRLNLFHNKNRIGQKLQIQHYDCPLTTIYSVHK